MLNPILDEALAYERLGLCVVPMNSRDKSPALQSWKKFQKERPTPAQIRRWFAAGEKNVGIVLGDVSSAVIVRDFDKIEAYHQWAGKFAEFARTLPTVQTARGRHVYARADVATVHALCKTTILKLGDGELRAGGLVVAPPSIHPSGSIYRWVRPLKALPPVIDVAAAGFIPCNIEGREPVERQEPRDDKANLEGREGREEREAREAREVRANGANGASGETETTKKQKIQMTLRRPAFEPFTDSDFAPEVLEQIRDAIQVTVPTARGQRHKLVFELCRALKAIPAISDAPALRLKNILRQWWEQSKPHSQTPWDEHLADFLEGWKHVKFPRGSEPMVTMLQRAREAEIPPEAFEFEQPEIWLLVSLCRELQRNAGEGPFYLSTRTAGRLLNQDHTTAHRWLGLLVNTAILELTERGSQNPKDRKANRYRYLLPF